MAPLKLSGSLINKGDLMRAMRELNSLNDFFVGAKARQAGSAVQMPKSSKVLEELAANNQINLLEETARNQLYAALKELEHSAPSLHMSFASEPSVRTLLPIITWLRENIDPQIFLSVGYQPAIAAGCVLRTPNKIIDMSMGAYLKTQTPVLMRLLSGSVHGS